jgi:hypothetical protein
MSHEPRGTLICRSISLPTKSEGTPPVISSAVSSDSTNELPGSAITTTPPASAKAESWSRCSSLRRSCSTNTRWASPG